MDGDDDSVEQADVMNEMNLCEPYWAGELADTLAAPRRTVTRRLNELADSGAVERKSRGERRVVYWREGDDD